jgi:hypothetical protein
MRKPAFTMRTNTDPVAESVAPGEDVNIEFDE